MPHPRAFSGPRCGLGLDEAVLGRPLLIQRTRLAGFRHHEAPRLWPVLRTGATLTLAAERDNPYDNEAVAVHWRTRKLGYLPRRENLVVARLLARRRRLSARIRRLIQRADDDRGLGLDVLLDRLNGPDHGG